MGTRDMDDCRNGYAGEHTQSTVNAKYNLQSAHRAYHEALHPTFTPPDQGLHYPSRRLPCFNAVHRWCHLLVRSEAFKILNEVLSSVKVPNISDGLGGRDQRGVRETLVVEAKDPAMARKVGTSGTAPQP